ncbi:gas vesicle protein [Myxococcus stipitatus]|uniref:gas vesicle protein n=1 Tax=Myxococcus stipitatus TaxID=83455 RepID=UPI001F1CA07A|nr:gas vesicle protein [Myxococcus stipitatus]MCE9670119.1 gas vesicle protein [Myxococcus stipitatus]
MNGQATTPESQQERASVLELLDRVLNKGVVISGDLVISVADVDLIYLGLRLLLTSVETALEVGTLPERPQRLQ